MGMMIMIILMSESPTGQEPWPHWGKKILKSSISIGLNLSCLGFYPRRKIYTDSIFDDPVSVMELTPG